MESTVYEKTFFRNWAYQIQKSLKTEEYLIYRFVKVYLKYLNNRRNFLKRKYWKSPSLFIDVENIV